jgi:hypothetical protein
MLSSSFRLVTARLIPRANRCKQTLLLATLILAGCGGSGEPKAQWQTVRGDGFSFRAPADWSRGAAKQGTVAVKDGDAYAQVSTFPLAKTYTAALFERVEPELAERMAAVARLAHGKVSGPSTVTVDGEKAHAFVVRAGGRTSRYIFVLRGKREFLLLCSADAFVCDELAASFSVA